VTGAVTGEPALGSKRPRMGVGELSGYRIGRSPSVQPKDKQ